MSLAIAHSFTRAASKLSMQDAGRALMALEKVREESRRRGLHIERVQDAGEGIFSARVSQGLRAILYMGGDSIIALYVGPHDDAYAWARRHEVGPHPVTGVVQIVELPEATADPVPGLNPNGTGPAGVTGLFPREQHSDDYLLSLGVPPSWLPTVRRITTDDELLAVAEKLPQEVAERLLDLAEGKFVTPPAPIPAGAPLAAHPDNLRRFYVLEGEDDLKAALERPLEDWIRFLHPDQRRIAEGEFGGPVKVTGSAGTGKTVVAMHRARALARRGRRVLLTSYVTTLCTNLERNLQVLCREEERTRIRVSTVHAEARRLVQNLEPGLQPVNDDELRRRLEAAQRRIAPELDPDFALSEWVWLTAQGLASWPDYRAAERRGRGRPLSVRERRRLWSVFERLLEDFEQEGRATWPLLCKRALDHLEAGRLGPEYDAVIVDEVQDLRPVEIRFLARLVPAAPAGPAITLVGDAGQRIYPGGFSLRSLGIETRGRSFVLRINYRTTEQIRRAADRILGDAADDLDGGTESRRGTRSLLRGPEPELRGFESADAEAAWVTRRIERVIAEGVRPYEIAVFGRSKKCLEPVEKAIREAGLPVRKLSRSDEEEPPGGINLGTMHRAKGLEFKAVFVVGCTAGRLPSETVLAKAGDPSDREAALARERSLLYVSLTRARDEATVTWSGEPSPFLADLVAGAPGGRGA